MAHFSCRSLFWFVALLVFFLDQATKALFRGLVPKEGAIEVIPGLFRLVHVWNPGVAFGLLARGGPWVRFLFLGINFLAFWLFLWVASKSKDRKKTVWAALVAGGALGNFGDRLLYGKVFDFLDFHWHQFHWPAFNLADAAISLGVLAFLLDSLLMFLHFLKKD